MLRKKIKPYIDITPRDSKRIIDVISGFIDDIPTGIPDITVAEFAEQYRVLPRGTPYPGPWRNHRTPYLIEIMESLSANSPVREVCFAKSAQVGATAMVENFIGYIIKCVPGPILYVTANEKLLNKWVSKRLTPLLISCGLDNKIQAQHMMKGQRRTGNRQFSKEFPGGSLDMVSAQSAANLRMDSIRYLILDEVDGYPWDVNKEGDPASIAKARTKAWKKRKKVLYISTPGAEEDSHIWPMYEDGDQRKYYVPCPFCDEYQVLEFGDTEDDHGMRWELDGKRINEKSIGYKCINAKCGKLIPETKKYGMIQKGEWRATVHDTPEHIRTYHIDCLSSLMEDWYSIVEQYLKTNKNPKEKRTFDNTYKGLPYREQGSRPRVENIEGLRGYYDSWTVPDDVLFMTFGADVQRGSEREDKQGPRIEVEFCGHGTGYKTWSIGYKVFEGAIDNHTAGAWEDFSDFLHETGLKFPRHDGLSGKVLCGLIDSGDGKHVDVVYNFCELWENINPSKGYNIQKKKKDLAGDEQGIGNFDRYRSSKIGGETTLYTISTNYYKNWIYRNLRVNRTDDEVQPRNFCDFPKQYGRGYFDMLVSEERRADGSYHAHGRRNEALDCRVLNIAAHDIWLDTRVMYERKSAQARGCSYAQQMEIRKSAVLKSYEIGIARAKANKK